jgi:hypothetical protein
VAFSNALANPKLQLYIPGATYETGSETWVYPGLEYDLWAIGSVNNPKDIIQDVKLAAAVKDGQSGTIAIELLEVNSEDIPDEMVTGSVDSRIAYFEDATPILGDGSSLPPHDIYPSDYFEFQLGNFLAVEQGIPDFNEDYDPDNPVSSNAWGQIKKYHVKVTGGYDWVHFDLYDHIIGKNKAVFAPFSHDSDAEDGAQPGAGSPAPEPTTLILLGMGLTMVARFGRRRLHPSTIRRASSAPSKTGSILKASLKWKRASSNDRFS